MTPGGEEQLLRLWVRNQGDVYRYIFALLPNANEAQEVLQATCVALWRKAGEIDWERPFLPLAFRFALLEVRKQRDRNRRWTGLLGDETLEQLSRERDATTDLLELRRQALDGCLAKLPAGDRDLIDRHYHRGMTVPQIAAATGQNIHTLYKALQRIRRQLMTCIDTRLATEPAP
ncbi:MAG: sigma-70 family RNA polymerase sigma factor [Pirellulaceae bacterium]|nr:sigma-70 family RNA polymerase sigma factor [Pirellulaceae bacterium]